MLNWIRLRLSYANVVATLALVIAIGTGGAYAASNIGASDLKKVTKRQGPAVQLLDGGGEIIGAQCRRNERVLRGGWNVVRGDPLNVSIQAVEPRRAVRPRRFEIVAAHRAGTPLVQVQANVHCLRR